MKTGFFLTLALGASLALAACGGGANNATNNSNANKANTNSNTVANTTTTTTTTTTTANSAANTATNSAANKAANTTKPAANSNSTASAKPPKGSTFECNDGTFSDAKTSQGACSGHQGIKKALKP